MEHKDGGNVKTAVITVSDRCSRGEREDQSGKAIVDTVEYKGWEVVSYIIIPDDKARLKEELIRLSDELGSQLIFTTGGTGLAPRDFTPEVTMEVLEKEVPGMAEVMRREGLKKTPHAMRSRAVCGVRGRTLIINLPGSLKAVNESLEVVLPAVPHAVELLKGEVTDC